MSYLDRIRECNTSDPSRYRAFLVAGLHVGSVRFDMARAVAAYPDVFEVTPEAVRLSPRLSDCAARSRAVERVLRALAKDGMMTQWRDEPYPVAASPGGEPLLLMERAAVPLFGVRACGVHLNGYYRRRGEMLMWIARRARDKATFPGLLDNMVAGGQPHGLSARATLIKEGEEEAGVPPALAARAIAVGAITYRAETHEGLRPDVQYCYDLELPEDFVPAPRDDEIESFSAMPIGKVAARVRDTGDFKFNCNLVVIDFLVRHGLIEPEHPDYLAIVAGLRQ